MFNALKAVDNKEYNIFSFFFYFHIIWLVKKIKIYKSYINICYHSNVEFIMVRSKVIKSE